MKERIRPVSVGLLALVLALMSACDGGSNLPDPSRSVSLPPLPSRTPIVSGTVSPPAVTRTPTRTPVCPPGRRRRRPRAEPTEAEPTEASEPTESSAPATTATERLTLDGIDDRHQPRHPRFFAGGLSLARTDRIAASVAVGPAGARRDRRHRGVRVPSQIEALSARRCGSSVTGADERAGTTPRGRARPRSPAGPTPSTTP